MTGPHLSRIRTRLSGPAEEVMPPLMTPTVPNLPSGEDGSVSRGWWYVQPDELAARFAWDADALMDALNPADFTDEQTDLVLAAIECCRAKLPARLPTSPGERHPRAPNGTLLSLDSYRLPILRALAASGGSLATRIALDVVGAALASELMPADRETLKNGSPRWRDRMQHARLQLVAEGLIAKHSSWGVWTITESGRQALLEGSSNMTSSSSALSDTDCEQGGQT